MTSALSRERVTPSPPRFCAVWRSNSTARNRLTATTRKALNFEPSRVSPESQSCSSTRPEGIPG